MKTFSMSTFATKKDRLDAENKYLRDLLKRASDAGNCCIDIFEDFNKDEIRREPKSIQSAWGIGKRIKEMSETEKKQSAS